MKISVVADGWARLMEATHPERVACRKAVMVELEERYRPQFERAGFFGRRILKDRMKREADAIVGKRLGLPSSSAMFFAAQRRCD